MVRQLEGEQEFAVDVGEQGKADHGNGCNLVMEIKCRDGVSVNRKNIGAVLDN